MKHASRVNVYVFVILRNLCAFVGARVLFYQINRQVNVGDLYVI